MTGSRLACCALLGLFLGGCGSAGYYAQSVRGHLELMSSTEPVVEVLADPATPPLLAERLRLAQTIRAFASEVLKLPHNGSYTGYADLGRDTLLWSLVAAPEFSLRPRQWCYPVIGCASYRGYFDRNMADAMAEGMRKAGYDVAVLPVQAYSTLGWFDDPLTNMVMARDDAGLAALVFHELAHQRIYVKDDSAFNESYATAVEEIGLELWLAQRDPQLLKDWYLRKRREQQRLELMRETRDQLERLYRDASLPDGIRRELKQALFEELGDALSRRAMARDGDGRAAGQSTRPLLNNAHLISVETYHQWVPAFLAIWQQQAERPEAFHATVERLAQLPRDKRDARLWALMPRSASAAQAAEAPLR